MLTPPTTEAATVWSSKPSAVLVCADSKREAVYSDFYDKRGFNLQVARRTPVAKTIQHFNRITHPRRGSFVPTRRHPSSR